MRILVTGGTGYIGSHTICELIQNGDEVIIVDNLVNSKLMVLDRIQCITGVKPVFYQVDCRDLEALETVFKNEKFAAIIHFAGLKAVGESVLLPDKYYDYNLNSTKNLITLMTKYDVRRLIFSSSATVYNHATTALPYTEDAIIDVAANPYGQTKIENEKLLIRAQEEHPDWSISLLRYANPIGAHPSGIIGEDPNDLPNNLLPILCQVAMGLIKELTVFGNDYQTPDGTCVRDYIHVMDLAKGHVLALQQMKERKSQLRIYNLGTGRGTSVLEMIRHFESANGIRIPSVVGPRRPGDLDEIYLSVKKAAQELGFLTTFSITDACKSGMNYYKNNR